MKKVLKPSDSPLSEPFRLDLNYVHLEMEIGDASKCSGFSLISRALIIVTINVLHHRLKALNPVNTANGNVYVAYTMDNEMRMQGYQCDCKNKCQGGTCVFVEVKQSSRI
jgi:hypothetical protein